MSLTFKKYKSFNKNIFVGVFLAALYSDVWIAAKNQIVVNEF